MPGKMSRDGLWKPPYVCLAPDPYLAWRLSGEMDFRHIIAPMLRDPEIPAYMIPVRHYHLWQVDLSEQTGFEELFFDNGEVKEVRVYERIFKRNVKWLAGRGI